MPKVSVVIASYQHARFVRQSIESVLHQTFQDFEIVITDDGSRDGTPDVIRQIADPRIKLEVFAENKGACTATNSAIARACGTYVAILNSDDYWVPTKLERQVAFLDGRADLAAVFALPLVVDERGAELPGHGLGRRFEARTEPRHWWLNRFFHAGNLLCHPTVLIRRSCYEELGGYDPRLAILPDLDMWIRLAGAHSFDVMPQRVTAFRILDNDANASAPRPEVRAGAMWEFEKILHRYVLLGDADFQRVFAQELARLQLSAAPKDVALARIALTVDRPSHQRFGLELLHGAASREGSGVEAREIAALAKSIDPYNLQTQLRAKNKSMRARAFRPVRSLLRSLRGRIAQRRQR